MATGLSATEANAVVNGLSGTFVQLHLTDPGAAGTSGLAVETDRVALTLGSAVAGSASNTGALTWTAVAATEDPQFFSLWTASTAGTFKFSGAVVTDGMTLGQDFTIAAGDLVITLSTVAA